MLYMLKENSINEKAMGWLLLQGIVALVARSLVIKGLIMLVFTPTFGWMCMCSCDQTVAEGCWTLALWKYLEESKLELCCYCSSALRLFHQPGDEGVHNSGLRRLLENNACQVHCVSSSHSPLYFALFFFPQFKFKNIKKKQLCSLVLFNTRIHQSAHLTWRFNMLVFCLWVQEDSSWSSASRTVSVLLSMTNLWETDELSFVLFIALACF